MKYIIKTIEELQKYASLDISSRIETMQPYLKQAEKEVLPLLGSAYYQQVLAAYDSDILTEIEAAILPYIQHPIALFAYWYAVPNLNLNVGESGFTVASNANFEPASQWRVDQFRESIEQSAHDALEMLMEFIEDNSGTYAVAFDHAFQKRFFVNSATEVNELVHTELRRIDFFKRKKDMFVIEQQNLRPVLGLTTFNALKTAYKAGTLSEVQQTLVDDFIRPAAAMLFIPDDEKMRMEGQRTLEMLADSLVDPDEFLRFQNSNDNGFFLFT